MAFLEEKAVTKESGTSYWYENWNENIPPAEDEECERKNAEEWDFESCGIFSHGCQEFVATNDC